MDWPALTRRAISVAVARGVPYWDAPDVAQSSLLALVEYVQHGEARCPEALLVCIARRQAVAHQRQRISERRSHIPLPQHIAVSDRGKHNREQAERVYECLDRLLPRRAEIIRRYYMLDQPRHQIIAEMGITAKVFELDKSKAIADLRELIERDGRVANSESLGALRGEIRRLKRAGAIQ